MITTMIQKKPRRSPSARSRGSRHPKTARPRMSGLDAAILVLKTASEPIDITEIMKRIKRRGLWASRKGKTPAQSINSAMVREIAKGADARILRVGRGLFTHANGPRPLKSIDIHRHP